MQAHNFPSFPSRCTRWSIHKTELHGHGSKALPTKAILIFCYVSEFVFFLLSPNKIREHLRYKGRVDPDHQYEPWALSPRWEAMALVREGPVMVPGKAPQKGRVDRCSGQMLETPSGMPVEVVFYSRLDRSL